MHSLKKVETFFGRKNGEFVILPEKNIKYKCTYKAQSCTGNSERILVTTIPALKIRKVFALLILPKIGTLDSANKNLSKYFEELLIPTMPT